MAKKPTAAPGMKMVITTGALAATLIGWAHIQAQDGTNTVQPEPVLTTINAAPPEWLLAPPPIPTLVPVATLQDTVVLPVAAQPVQVPVVQQVVPVAPAAQAPITVTRSSR